MDHLIYTAVSGANRSLSQQQIHSNNLANVNTSGFRGDLESALSQQVAGSGYDSRYLVQEQNSGVDMTPGAVRDTGRELDIAIKGNGLIAVGNGNREVYTRNGQMDVSPDGDLTINGRPVIGETGPVVLPPFPIFPLAMTALLRLFHKTVTLTRPWTSIASNWWIFPQISFQKTPTVCW